MLQFLTQMTHHPSSRGSLTLKGLKQQRTTVKTEEELKGKESKSIG